MIKISITISRGGCGELNSGKSLIQQVLFFILLIIFTSDFLRRKDLKEGKKKDRKTERKTKRKKERQKDRKTERK